MHTLHGPCDGRDGRDGSATSGHRSGDFERGGLQGVDLPPPSTGATTTSAVAWGVWICLNRAHEQRWGARWFQEHWSITAYPESGWISGHRAREWATDDRIGLGSDNDRCGIGGVDLPLRAMGVADDEQASSIAPIYCRWPWEGLICGHHHGSGDWRLSGPLEQQWRWSPGTEAAPTSCGWHNAPACKKKKPFLRAVGLPTYEIFNFHTPDSWRCYTTNENIFLPFVINTVM